MRRRRLPRNEPGGRAAVFLVTVLVFPAVLFACMPDLPPSPATPSPPAGVRTSPAFVDTCVGATVYQGAIEGE